MRTKAIIAGLAVGLVLSGESTSVQAQQPQIPTLQVCNLTKVEGKAVVKIASRSDAAHSGVFKVGIEVKCDPQADGYPAGTLKIEIDMSDSSVQGTLTGVTFEQLTSTGKHSPTAYLNGRCKAARVSGCRFWLVVADNGQQQRGTPDVIGFLVFDGTGKRVAYGTGPVVEGDVKVSPTSN